MEAAIAAVRRFNRFYTQRVGALAPRFLDSELTLSEARLLFEIVNAQAPVATDLQAKLAMDAGYVSRVLRTFETRGLIRRERSKDDGRRRPIVLTDAGRALFAMIDARQRAQVADMLEPIAAGQRTDLVAALSTARALLGAPPDDVSIRTFRPGDMGLIAARQSMLYREAYGWGSGIEVNVGGVTTVFLRDFKPGREQCWVAECDGAMAGSIFLTDEGDGLARLRLLYVEPFARRHGIGDKLVSTCVAFARAVGYDAITLWTHTILESARRIYKAHGFRLIETKMHNEFGMPVQGETWRLNLRANNDDRTSSGTACQSGGCGAKARSCRGFG